MPARRLVQGRRGTESKAARARQRRQKMTPAERARRARLRRRQLDGFYVRRNQIIAGFIAGFYCHAAGLVVDVDGAIHDQQAGHDAERNRILAARHLQILRFANNAVVHDPARVPAEITPALHAPNRAPATL